MRPIELTEKNFDEIVTGSAVPVLVDFFATWCGPCKLLSPIVDEIADESDGTYTVCKVNVDEEPGLAGRFGVMSIPTLIVFKNGQTKQSVGLVSKDRILSLIKE